MGHPDGAHTHGSGGGELLGLAALALIVGGVIAAVLRAIWHTIVEAAEIAAIVIVSAIGAAVLAGAAYGALRIRAYVLERRARRPVPVRAKVVRLGAEPERPALEAPRKAWPLPGSWDEIRPRIGRDS